MATVMVVDDSSIIRLRVRDILTKRGHNVVTEAENGILAVRRFKEYKPELVTMDITMPEMDGITALKKILEINPKTKIVMISAIGQKFIVLDALKSGAAHFIVKPFEEDKVIQVIQEVLNFSTGASAEDSIKVGRGIEEENSTAIQRPNMEKQGSGPDVSAESPFVIENINGTLIINILRSIKAEQVQGFKSVVQGLIHVKPLNMIFDFGDLDYLERSVLGVISNLVKGIIEAEGKYLLSSRNLKFSAYVRTLKLANMCEFTDSY